MKKILTYTISFALYSSTQAAITATSYTDDFDDNMLAPSKWIEGAAAPENPVSFSETSQHLNTLVTPPFPGTSQVEHLLYTKDEFTINQNWSATIDVYNLIDLTSSPSLRIGVTLGEYNIANSGGIFLKADNGGLRLQTQVNQGFYSDVIVASLQNNGTIAFNYNKDTNQIDVGFANGVGSSVTNHLQLDTSSWNLSRGFSLALHATSAGTPSAAGEAYYDNFAFQSVPEPSSTLLLSMAGLILFRRNRG